jgi:tRNA (guanine37-N1)-methyltransferase
VRIEVVTLFPALIEEALRYGVVGRALERGLLQVGTEDPRAHTRDAYRRVDDRPYGGGPGMVLKPEPLCAAIAAAATRLPAGSARIALSAQGTLLTQAVASRLAALPGLLLVAGRYEGIDERVLTTAVDRELSIGDYVVSGGELPALVLIDVLARLTPGVLGDERSSVEESFGEGLLDWPQYTRPEVFEGARVPAVLSSGDHAAIRRWRLKQSVGRTWLRRPELIGRAPLDAERSELLREFLQEQREGAGET